MYVHWTIVGLSKKRVSASEKQLNSCLDTVPGYNTAAFRPFLRILLTPYFRYVLRVNK